MKNYIILILVIFSVGCEKSKFLDRPAKDALQLEEFFKSENDLKLATNNLYKIFLWNLDEGDNVYHLESYGSDNIVSVNFPAKVSGSRIVPPTPTSAHGEWNWGQLRDINFVIDNYAKVDNPAARTKYSGIAKFFRAYFYFDKLRNYGDVPWIGHVLLASEREEIFKSRDSREVVADSILADLDYAIANIPAAKQVFEITQYTALALKARVGLFEGTYRKYHGLGNYEKYLNAAVSAAQTLMNTKAYTIYSTGGPKEAYRNLFTLEDQNSVETILAQKFVKGVSYNKIGHFMTTPSGSWSLPKDLVNSYLMDDGSRFTDKPNYETVEYFDEMQDRDPRLTQTTAGPGFKVLGESAVEPFDFHAGISGYRVIKALPSRDQWSINGGRTDIILFRFGEVLLNYAEAKAELGMISQNDLDISINILRDRVQMPHLNLADANTNPDQYLAKMYPNVGASGNTGVTLEIRRERRIELFNEGFRWDDLMRWKEGKKIEQPMVGIYFPHLGAFDMNNDGIPDVYLYDGDDSGIPPSIPTSGRVNVQYVPLRDPVTGQVGGTSGNLMPHPSGAFQDPRDYLYPIPTSELVLNKNLKQNPGW